MIPSELSKFTSPIVDKALETGGRGGTTTHTNYGVIGDAMFKKAQLDLDMASLQTNTSLRVAELNHQMGMDNAQLQLDKGQIMMQADQQMWERGFQERQFAYEKSLNEASESESLLGSLSGAVSGAVGGFALGGPVGAVIGGAAGGLMTYGSYKSGGRAAGHQAQQTMGVIAGGAQILKGLHDEKKANDAWDTMVKTGQGILDIANDPSQDAQTRQAAMDQWDTHLQDLYSFQVSDMKMNPAQAMEGVQNYKQAMMGGFSSNKEAGQYEMTKNALDFAADIQNTDDPSDQRQKVHDFRGKQAIAYAKMTGGDEMPESLFSAYLDQTEGLSLSEMGSGKQRSLDTDANNLKLPDNELGIQAPEYEPNEDLSHVASKAAMRPGLRPSQVASMTRDNASVQDYAQKNALNQQHSTIPNQGDQSPRRATEVGTLDQWRPPLAQGKGVQMDDGLDIFTQPVNAERELSKMGAESVKVLNEDDGDDEGVISKMKHNMSLKDEEFDEKRKPVFGGKSKAKVDVDEDGDSNSKIERKLFERHQKVNAELETVLNKDDTGQGHEVLGNIDSQLEKIENGDLKTFGSKGANFGRAISKDGVEMKVPFGGPSFGSIGKDAQWTNDEEEFAHWNEVDQMTEINASTLARLSGEKGAMSNADIERFKKLAPSPGKTKEQNIQGLIAQKELLARKLGAKVLKPEKGSKATGPSRGSAAWYKQERDIHRFKQDLKDDDDVSKSWWEKY